MTVIVQGKPQRPIVVETTEAAAVSVRAGVKGEKGDPGIHVGATPPANPSINDLWVDIS